DQALDFKGAAALLAGGGLAARALMGGARQHAVLGRDPAASLSLEPGRQAVLQRCRHQHMGVAELHETRPFGVLHDGAVERNGAQLIRLSAARPHRQSFGFWQKTRQIAYRSRPTQATRSMSVVGRGAELSGG